ncbi:MAG TPA: DEAD/DEAH box helicase [Deltaproteobacteria bacterium]|nr:DEAD/DEAH box helicase [Deltaproteobacteria bacterium]HOM29234.1 DEAD/DEAH box helicase [Deltaproteobacteria bacterium]HPP79954.1 DEAD/DEAH box helicase [Deltaproteobacteria bacterium]
MQFHDLALDERILKGIEDAGFTTCTEVQAASLPYCLDGRDVCVQSQTGSGKTAVFLITIFQRMMGMSNTKALIIVPTRELAVQVEREAGRLGAHLDYRTACIYGGVGYKSQEQQLKLGANIVVGTPGRLLDLHRSGTLPFKDIGILVIDEADRLFDMGFIKDLRKMLRAMPPAHKRQTMLFSATLSFLVKELAWQYMNDPVEIEIAPERLTVDTVTQELYHVSNEEKMSLLLGLLNREKPKNCMIFTNMKSTAENVARRLRANGIECEYITGDLPQKRRIEIIDALKTGRVPILVATNVAARGLHVDELDLVINYDLPEDCEDYVHRIGRTARVGRHGKAISIACEDYVYSLEAIERYINMKIPVVWPDEGLFVEDRGSAERRPRMRGKRHPREAAGRPGGRPKNRRR